MTEELVLISELNPSNLKVKPYLPFPNKRLMVDTILNQCVKFDHGIAKVDYVLFKLTKETVIIAGYTNIDLALEEDLTTAYDELRQKGILKQIFNRIDKDELELFETILDKEIAQILSVNNSLLTVVAAALNKLIDKMPTEEQLDNLLANLDIIDPDKLSSIKSLFKQSNE